MVKNSESMLAEGKKRKRERERERQIGRGKHDLILIKRSFCFFDEFVRIKIYSAQCRGISLLSCRLLICGRSGPKATIVQTSPPPPSPQTHHSIHAFCATWRETAIAIY